MKSSYLVPTLLLAAAVAASAADDEPVPQRAADLAPPVPITVGGEPIEVQGFAAPFVGDVDEDGKNDLLVGQSHLGLLRLYRNEGTNAQPRFERSEWLTAAGRVASVPRCCRVGFTPQLVDFDGDGRTDIVTGAGAGEAYVFRRNEEGSFGEAEVLVDNHGQIIMRRSLPSNRVVPYNSTASAYDWDQDGDLDLLVRQCLIPNEGTRNKPVFGDAVQIEADGKPIYRGAYTPCVADWDGDGKNDLLANRVRDIVWYRNTGDNRQPVLTAPEVLVPITSENPYSHDRPDNEPSAFQAFCVTDFNSDGRLDLVVGDFRHKKLPELDEQKEAEMKKLMARRSDAIGDYWDFMRDRDKSTSPQELVDTSRQVLRKWQDYATVAAEDQFLRDQYRMRGRVWFYERLATTDPASNGARLSDLGRVLAWARVSSHHGACLRGGVFTTRTQHPFALRHHAACPRGAVFPSVFEGTSLHGDELHGGVKTSLDGVLVVNIARRGRAPAWREITSDALNLATFDPASVER